MPDRLRAITAALRGVCAPFLRRFCAREKASIMRALSLLLATGAAAAMVACGGGSVFPPESGVPPGPGPGPGPSPGPGPGLDDLDPSRYLGAVATDVDGRIYLQPSPSSSGEIPVVVNGRSYMISTRSVVPDFEVTTEAAAVVEIRKGNRSAGSFLVAGANATFTVDGFFVATISVFNGALFSGDEDDVPFFYDADEFADGLPTLDGGFHLIRNVYQLQAIAGVDHRGQSIEVFGANRRASNYRLAGDIDAAPSGSEGWSGGSEDRPSGFFPIAYGDDSFIGNFDGGGHEIRDLFINRRDGMAGVGLFGNLGPNAVISNARLENARVAGNDYVGSLVGRVRVAASRVRIENSRARGEVFGEGGNIGGLVGNLLDSTVVEGSWFAGRVWGGVNVGGLIGQAGIRASVSARNNWALAQVFGAQNAGGLVGGWGTDNRLENSWSGGPVIASARDSAGGLIGAGAGSALASYASGETSGQDSAGGDMGAILVDSLLTISDSSWDSSAIWDFGGDNNFPILRSFDANAQGAAIADGLTRIVLPISGNALPVFPPGAVAAVDSDYSILRLDTNGLAPNIGGGANPPPSCAFADGRLSASTYNGVVVNMRVLAGGAARLTPYNDADCLAGLSGNPGEATLRLSFASGGYSFYRDYRLTITAAFAAAAPSPVFVAPTEERFTVNLDSVVGEGVLTVSVDGVSPRIFDATVEGFSTGGGSPAVVTLLSALDSIFTRDEQLIMMTLRADDALGQTASYTVTLASQPREIDGEPFSNLFLAAQATAGATVAPAAAVNARIWHLFEQSDTRRFTLLDDADGLFRIDPDNGEVSFARTAAADDFATHELTLILLGGDPGLTARQSARIRIRERSFLYIDDEDKGAGTSTNPFLIYDVYQLQAINGALSDEAVAELAPVLNITADAVISLAATVFGTTAIERLSRHYRLAVDIDAAVARGWNGGAGFAPIGDAEDFAGGFDGGGYAIRDLRISVSGDYAGLFTGIGAAAAISDLLLQEIDVSGGDNAGALAGRLRNGSLISRVGAYGRVVGATAGGLAGIAAGGTVSQSWFAGEVVARGDGGGLFGSISAAVDVDRAWTAARVSVADQAGGLSPNFIGRITGSWAAGELEGASIGGLVDGAGVVGAPQATMSYWSVDTTGASVSASLGISIARVEQLTVADLGSGWNVGGGEDFPVLTILSESPQKLGVAYGLTRLQAVNKSIRGLSRFGVNEGGEDFAVMRLDLDGAADGRGVACVYDRDAGVLRANPGYNDLRIVVSLVGDGGVIQQYDDNACLFGVSALAGDRTLRLRYESAAGAALVVDYALSLAVDITAPGPAVGPVISLVSVSLGEEIVIPSDATLHYPALTVSVVGIDPMLSLLPGDDGFALSVSSSPATLLLTTTAVSLFTSDGLRVTAELSALDFLGRGTRATAVFRSAPLGRDGPSVVISLPQERLARDEVVLSTSDVGIEIWHYTGATMFSLLTDAPDIFGVFANNGRVYLRRSLDSSDYGNYNLTLVGIGDDGVRGEQALEVGIGRLPFIYSSGRKGSGTADDPFQIFDIYQLQAIAGTLSSEAAAEITTATGMSEAVLQSLAANVFGDMDERLGAHYRLMNDIDAASTRGWDGGAGFAPIGGDFTGVFGGGGMVVSSLFIDLLDDDNPVGLFAGVNGGAVSSVGLAQARVTGGANAGALIGVLSGGGRVVGVRVLGGLVVGGTVFSPNSGIGGLVGRADQSRVAASWSSAEVVGLGQTPVGGLIGQQGGSEATVAGSWSSGRVSAPFDHGGGLIGLHEGGQIEESWSLSEIIDLGLGGSLGGGLVGSRTSALAATNSYWSVETSGLTVSGDGIGVDTLQTLTVGQLSSLYWDLGETPDSDFPLLAGLSAVEQAIGIGRGMLRLRSVNDDENDDEVLSSFVDNEIDESHSLLRLDLNGAAENTAGQGRTSTPECIFIGGELHTRVPPYNDVRVRLQAVSGAEFLPIENSASICVIGLRAPPGEGVLRAIVSSYVSDSAVPNLTVDYPFSVAATITISPPSVGAAASPQIEADFPDAVAAIESGAAAGDFRYFRAGPSTVATNYRNADLTVRDGFRVVDLFSSHPDFDLSPDATSGDETAASLRLARPAADIFAADNQVVTVTIGATDVLGRSDSTVARFRSTPRAFDGAIVSFFFNYDENLSQGVTLLPAADVTMTAWHLFGAPLRFTVAGDGATLFMADPKSGGVAFARDILSADFGLYDLTLLLSGVSDGGFSVTVRKPLRVFLGLEPGRYGGRDEGTGTAADPYLIYDVYQLQAIDSVYPSEAAAELATVWGVNVLTASMEINTLFGAGVAPWSSHYRLVSDIDATPTRGWGATGFSPIGDTGTDGAQASRFQGSLDGAGFVIKGLSLSVSGNGDGGLFSGMHTSAAVRNLGLAEVDVRARVAGAISGRSFGLIENSWVIGRVIGRDLAGGLIGAGDRASTNLISLSWFAGDVEFNSGSNAVGGLIGRIGNGNEGARVFSSWAMARVRNFVGGRAGGIVGQGLDGGISNSWSGSPVVSGSPGGGVAAEADSDLAVSNVYFDRSSSGVDNAAGAGSISSAFAVDTMTTVSVGAWPSANWNFGDTDAADGTADYPILRTNSADWQKIGLSYGLTRVVAVGAASDTTLRINAANTASGDAFDLLRFDMIGGADFLSAQRHSPDASCSSEADPAGGEILVVAPNFNGAVARVSLVRQAVANLRTANNGCAFYLESTSDDFDATLRVTYSVGEAVLVADYPLSDYDGASDRSALAGPLMLDSEPPSDPPGQTIVVVPVDATANYSPLTLTAFAASIFTSRESTLFEGAGNDLATIFMREAAVSLFAVNNRIYTVSFFAADRRTRTASFTAAFRSAPRVIDGGRAIFVVDDLSRGQTVLAAADVRATIWHLHGAPLRYELDESSTTGGNLFRVDSESGQVELAANLDDGVYRVALVARAMVDGEEFSARQDAQIFIGVTPPPFLYHNLPKGDGSVADPYLIYDAYLLQAIGGADRFPREALTVMASLSALLPDETEQVIADLFGDDAARATASYLLANDIDASIARDWDLEASEARGFSPIGTEAAPFRGRFDGGGNRINDLFIRRPDANSAVGLFAQADAAFFANLEIANARVSGGGDTGALVGAVAGAATVTSVWAQGRVESTNEEADRGIGGLIGRYAGELTVARSWFAGEASGGTNVGGLIGLGADGATVNVQESWTAARVSATVTVAGGLLAKGSGGNLRRSWAVGPVTASSAAGGLVGDGVVAALQGYWDAGVSGQTDSAAGLSVDLRTITDTQIDGAWVFGTDSDFPILDGINVTAQNAAIAAGLTRISVVASVSRTDFQVFEIDVNGDEPNESGARAPVCAFVDGGVRATTGYNNQVVVVRSTGDGRLTRATGATDECRFVIQTDRPQPVLLSVSFGGLFYETIDAGVTRALNGEGLDEFLAAVDWTAVVDGTIYGERDDDNDRILNAYDYSPLGTFDLHYVEDGVITTFADGSPQYPFPIHNVWQLQAISGEDRAPSHLTGGTFAEFFGDAARRVRAHYYLAADIDAASTRGWNRDAVGAPIGFYPLVGFESGGAVIDGRGRIIDGLYINSASEDAGLFARFAGAASNFGIDNARVFAVDGRAGLLAGSIVGGSAASVWGRGRVIGGDDAVALGGLIGALSATPLAPISQSWFAGEVAGGGVVGGLIGSVDEEWAIEDNWAVARVAGAESAVGGLIGETGATVRRSWAGGPLAGAGQIGGLVGATLNTAVGEQSYWEHSLFGGDGIRSRHRLGDDADLAGDGCGLVGGGLEFRGAGRFPGFGRGSDRRKSASGGDVLRFDPACRRHRRRRRLCARSDAFRRRRLSFHHRQFRLF